MEWTWQSRVHGDDKGSRLDLRAVSREWRTSQNEDYNITGTNEDYNITVATIGLHSTRTC